MRTLEMMISKKAVFRLTGVSFCADTVARLHKGDVVHLTPQPDNPHDPNAIRATSSDGAALGWMPAPLAARLAGEGVTTPLVGHVTALRTYEGRVVGADVVVDGVLATQVVPA